MSVKDSRTIIIIKTLWQLSDEKSVHLCNILRTKNENELLEIMRYIEKNDCMLPHIHIYKYIVGLSINEIADKLTTSPSHRHGLIYDMNHLDGTQISKIYNLTLDETESKLAISTLIQHQADLNRK